MRTAFLWDERCFWHGGGQYAELAPVGGFVQPMEAGGLPEAPETKRRLKNLLHVTGLVDDLVLRGGRPATRQEILRVHDSDYIAEFARLSDAGGGEIGLRTPFGPGGFEIAACSAGLVREALFSVLRGEYRNAYALSRPPGHHCLPGWPNGFCLLNNIAIAIEAARAEGLAQRFAVVDWDVHHGNGTEHIFYERDDVLTVSVHQTHCYPPDTGEMQDIGKGAGAGANMNIPLPAGAGHSTYLEAMDRLIVPKLRHYQPDVVIVACGFDASGVDPIARQLCESETFRAMTHRLMDVTDDRLVLAHEGGYSALHVPFCGHAVLEALSGSGIRAGDPLGERIRRQQPDERIEALFSTLITEMVEHFDLKRSAYD